MLQQKGAIVVVESNFCFLQMRKLRLRGLPEFIELIAASPGLLIQLLAPLTCICTIKDVL